MPSNIPATLDGKTLLAPCTGPYGDPLAARGLTDPAGLQRGMLFSQDRSAKDVNLGWGGGGQFLLAGSMYFHPCNAAGTGVSCDAAGIHYTHSMSFCENTGSGTYVIGSIISDNIEMYATPGITVDLNRDAADWILKASLLP